MTPLQPQEEIAKVMSQIPVKLYANGFNILMSNADVSIMLIHNNAAMATLNISYTTAKSLAQRLSQGIGDLEKRSNQPIMTSDDVAKYIQEGSNE